MWPRHWSATFAIIRARTSLNPAAPIIEQARSFHNTFRSAAHPRPWTSEEDVKLLKLRGDGWHWNDIEAEMPSRTVAALRIRYALKRPRGPRGEPIRVPLKSVSSRNGRRWTPHEDSLLLELKERGEKRDIIRLRLQLRSLDAIDTRYRQIAPRTSSGDLVHGHRLKDADRELIGRLRSEGVTWKEIQASHFPNHARQSLENWHWTGGSSKLRKRLWTAAERQLLLRLRAEKQDWLAIGAQLQRSAAAAQYMHRMLVQGADDPAPPRRDAFSPEENAAIVCMVRQEQALQDIARMFPSRTPGSIEQRVHFARRYLGLPPRRHGHDRLLNSQEIAHMVSLRKSGSDWSIIQDRFPRLSIAQLKSINATETTHRNFAASVEAVEAQNSASSSGE